MSKWMIVLPPEGAAREVGFNTVEAFTQVIDDGSTKVFDTKTYLDAFDSLLKEPDDTLSVDLLNQSLVINCLDAQVTHCLVLALSPITLFSLQLLRRQGIKTVHWFYEDYRIATYWKDILSGYDHFFAVQKGVVEEECARRGVSYSFLQTAGTPHVYSKTRHNVEYDCAFVGIPSAYRVALLEGLFNNGISLCIAGAGWDTYRGILEPVIYKGQWSTFEEALSIYNKARVALNISNQDPSSDRISPQISPRVFDVFATNATLIVEKLSLNEKVMKGFSYKEFETIKELVGLVRDSKQHPPEIVQLHQKMLHSQHQYRHRVESLLEIIR
jgi:spore maturation protein CgeB